MTHELKESNDVLGSIESITKTDTDFFIEYVTGEKAKLNILNNHIFKYYMSPTGEFSDYPTPNNPEDVAKINSKKISDYDIKYFQKSSLEDSQDSFVIHTDKLKIIFDKKEATMTVFDKRSQRNVLIEIKPLSYVNEKVTQELRLRENEHFFGGGMQNGRFSHRGEIIHIVNSNNWVDGGVTSPNPFYWSNYGYGVLRNTWQPGTYNFGHEIEHVKTRHNGNDFDAFFFINIQPKDILNDYYELTGYPIFMPEFAFYEAHLNAYNRDYWVKVTPDTSGAILFEDGFFYKCYQPKDIGDKTGILESLNGENDNYQFSARAVIDRYRRHDMPVGWFIPNDGYGSGYGQTDSLDGDIGNLKEFRDYARERGIEVALWTESQLEPKDPLNPQKGERDLKKEVGVAGVVALKCDVAWIGDGYSFGLNAVENATKIFLEGANNRLRPLIIMVDGWAGTQRYSGIWSGDQNGGEWEYIRFHIPTYIGSGLSGQPVVGSDMDGIYAGKLREVNVRDFQWKTFTPLQLNMDGWGKFPKTPFTFDDEITSINRAYLKQKSMLMPYNYTIGYESTHGLPMVRAMFLEFPEEAPAYTDDSKYQYMWGPNILVAPIYNAKGLMDASIRDGILLPGPEQVWIDFFTGEKYQGGKILNNIKAPIWKIPVFIKDGAIIPMTDPNNNPNEIKRDHRIFNIYVNDESRFEVYEDDGKSRDYLNKQFATTKIEVNGPKSNEQEDLFISINKTCGDYENMVKVRSTELRIMASKPITKIKVAIDGKPIVMSNAGTEAEYADNENVYYFRKDFSINPYLNAITNDIWNQKFLLIKLQKTDVSANDIHITIRNFINEGKIFGNNTSLNETLAPPCDLAVLRVNLQSVTLFWQTANDAKYYEIERNGTVFTNIIGITFTFDGLKYESTNQFRIRSVNDHGVSVWSPYISAVVGEDPYKYAVKEVKVTCDMPCERGQEVCNLTDGDLGTIWHTDWKKPHLENITLTFDLGHICTIDKVEYTPRQDGGNGTISTLEFSYSDDNEHWSPNSTVNWSCDNTIKTIELSGKRIRYMKMKILDSLTGFGSGRLMTFFESRKARKTN